MKDLEMSDYTCYLDMDGVCTDFVVGVLDFHKSDIRVKDVRWGMEEQLKIDKNTFWKGLDYFFWSNLAWTGEGQTLIQELEDIFGDNIAIVSSPCKTIGCRDGKAHWVENYLPNYKDKLFLGNKFNIGLLASPNKILIDDHELYISQFKEAGGKGILVPRPWNKRISETDEYGRFDVKKLIKEVKNAIST